MSTQALDETRNNYIMCIVYLADRYGVSIADITTGDYFVTEIETDRKLMDEITKFAPAEIICNESFRVSGVDQEDIKIGWGSQSISWMTGILMMIFVDGLLWSISMWKL